MGRRRRKDPGDTIIAMAGPIAALVLLLLFIAPGSLVPLLNGLLALGVFAVVALGLALLVKGFLRQRKRAVQGAAGFHEQADGSRVDYSDPMSGHDAAARNPGEWSLSDLHEKLCTIDWFQFEKLVTEAYRLQGYTVNRRGGAKPGGDGGVDLIIERNTEQAIVQCKHWSRDDVGVKYLRELCGTMADMRIYKGVFVTLTDYTEPARDFAARNGIQIVTRDDLVGMLVNPNGYLYSSIFEILQDDRKFCPRCESPMVVRTSRRRGNSFWGCSAFPRCRYIMPDRSASGRF